MEKKIVDEKRKIARKEIQDFRDKMNAIGFTTEEIVQLMYEKEKVEEEEE